MGGGCYLVDLFAAFLAPDFGQKIHVLIVIPCTIAELWMVGYLLVVDVKTVKTVELDERILTAA